MKKNDIKLIISIIIIAMVFILGRYLLRQGGSYAVVYVDGKETARYSLSEDRTVTIDGYDGGTNTLVISDGKAYLSEADCPDKLCVGMGAIQYDGETIVCLPHKVVIEIESKNKDEISGDAIDVVAQ